MARTYTGYTFDNSAAGTVLSGTITEDGSLVLKVYYTANPYTVSYNANDGQGTLTDTESPYICDETVTVLANGFTRTGYNFTGWNTAADGSGTAYAAGNTFNMPAADVILFAQWKSSNGDGSGSGSGSGTVVNPVPPGEDSDSSQTVIVDPIPPTLNKEEHFAYIIGYPENVVRPERFITREEVATVFYRLLDEDYRATIKTTVNDFPDVGMDRWSSKYIATLANGGIIVGYPDKSFRPHNSITRAEVATIASKFDKLSIMDTNKFSDVSGHWAKGYINSAVEKGWINGYPDNIFKPDQYITRAEFVTLVNNVLERCVHREDILPEAKQFPDLEIESWYYEAMQEAINSHYYNRKADTYEEWLQIYYPDLEM
uniref:Cellulosome-anchoring protein n=1 Tax=uncultured bacterium pBIO2079 TaxID=1478040 RepID=A0A075FA86_9BACT|nr:cellulosome-anchoring protein [uncultured bacterium pBIO2079]